MKVLMIPMVALALITGGSAFAQSDQGQSAPYNDPNFAPYPFGSPGTTSGPETTGGPSLQRGAVHEGSRSAGGGGRGRVTTHGTRVGPGFSGDGG